MVWRDTVVTTWNSPYQTFTSAVHVWLGGPLARYAVFIAVAPLSGVAGCQTSRLVGGWRGGGVVGLATQIYFSHIAPGKTKWCSCLSIVAGYYLPPRTCHRTITSKALKTYYCPGIVGATLVGLLRVHNSNYLPYLAGPPRSRGAQNGAYCGILTKTPRSRPPTTGRSVVYRVYMLFRRFERGISKLTHFGVLGFWPPVTIIRPTRLYSLPWHVPQAPPADQQCSGQHCIVTTLVLAAIYYAAAYRRQFTEFGRRVLSKKSQTQVPCRLYGSYSNTKANKPWLNTVCWYHAATLAGATTVATSSAKSPGARGWPWQSWRCASG